MAPRLLVGLATYNEKENLRGIVTAIGQNLPDADIVIVDDNSPDGTGQLADQLATENPHIHVIHRRGKLGLGTAIITGMRFAIDHDYDWFINMDADFSHDPRFLPRMLWRTGEVMVGKTAFRPPSARRRKPVDIVIGSRYVPGGGVRNWPWSRRLASFAVNAVARVLLRLPAKDTSGAYRCYRVARLRQVDLSRVWSRGYSFQEEFLYRCRKVGCRIVEVPIIFEDRRAGQSKVDLFEAVRSMAILLVLGIMVIFGRDRA